MAKTCTCSNFQIGMTWISGCEGLAYVHGSRMPESVPIMRYCAWCGRELKDEDETKLLPRVTLSTEDEL